MWTAVVEDRSVDQATALRVDALPTGGFLLHTRGAEGEGDIWLETEREVRASLAAFYVLGDVIPEPER